MVPFSDPFQWAVRQCSAEKTKVWQKDDLLLDDLFNVLQFCRLLVLLLRMLL